MAGRRRGLEHSSRGTYLHPAAAPRPPTSSLPPARPPTTFIGTWAGVRRPWEDDTPPLSRRPRGPARRARGRQRDTLDAFRALNGPSAHWMPRHGTRARKQAKTRCSCSRRSLRGLARSCWQDHSPGMHSSPAACYRCSTREASADSIRGTSSTQRWPFPTAAIFPRPTTFENAPPAVSWPTGACVELAVDSHLFTPSIERYVLQYAPALTG